jgi:hypothetical protein
MTAASTEPIANSAALVPMLRGGAPEFAVSTATV